MAIVVRLRAFLQESPLPIIARLINANDVDTTNPRFRPDQQHLHLKEIGYTLLPDGTGGAELGNILQVNDQTMVVANWYWVTHTVPTLEQELDGPPVAVRTPHLEVWLIDIGEAQKRQRAATIAQARAQAGGGQRVIVPPGVLNGLG